MKKYKLFLSLLCIMAFLLASSLVQANVENNASMDVFTQTLSIKASFSDCAYDDVAIQIVPYGIGEENLKDKESALKNTLYFGQDKCDKNGLLSIDIPFKQKSGKYTLRLLPTGYPGTALELFFDVVSYDDAKMYWNNLTDNPSENLKKLLLALNVSDETILSMADDPIVHKEIKSYDNPGNFTRENTEILIEKIKKISDDVKSLRAIFKKLSEAKNISQVNSIISDRENSKILGTDKYLERYNKLSSTKSVDTALFNGKYGTKEEFIGIFVEALDAAEYDDNKKTSTSSSKWSPSFSGGNSLGTTINVTPTVTPFTDIEVVPWAKEAIEDLYTKGIINGKAYAIFAPNDNISREEFIKMVVVFMGINSVNENVCFDDVDSNAWYAPYISTALKYGFVNGYSESVFGIGDYITREDVAVILSRICNTQIYGTPVSFSDAYMISDYAKDAVNKLSAMAIINGSDGKFNPKNKCTRAETACMIYRLSAVMN